MFECEYKDEYVRKDLISIVNECASVEDMRILEGRLETTLAYACQLHPSLHTLGYAIHLYDYSDP